MSDKMYGRIPGIIVISTFIIMLTALGFTISNEGWLTGFISWGIIAAICIVLGSFLSIAAGTVLSGCRADEVPQLNVSERIICSGILAIVVIPIMSIGMVYCL